MKIAFLLATTLHGLIHVLGFVKGTGIKKVNALSLPISKPMGIIWLVAAVLFFVYIILQLANNEYNWLAGFIAVVCSQVLIILFWKDAKFGTLPNILIFVVSIISFGNYRFQRFVEREKAQLVIPNNNSEEKIISERDIKHLPKPIIKWLRQTGAIEKPYISVGMVVQQAKIKMKPDQKKWMTATARQYSAIDNPAFIWTTNVKVNSLLYFQGRDKFAEGKGEMLIILNSLLNVVDERGKKINEGSIQRYLGEMVWFPSLALSPYISWETIDSTTVKATMEFEGTKGSGTFHFNSDGDFIKFSALRFMENKKNSKRYEWVLLVDSYESFGGIKVPVKMTATWKLEEGDWTWLILEVKDIKYNKYASG